VTAALYATIWLSLTMFVAALTPRRRDRDLPVPDWRWHAYATGAVLCMAHILLAMGVHHHWSHEAAVAETAARSAQVYGLGWRGGIYVNYAFILLWVVELIWWRIRPYAFARRSPVLVWSVRAFYFVVLFNAAIVFASPAGRIAGLGLLAWLSGSAVIAARRTALVHSRR
jgi:hypothetical protein